MTHAQFIALWGAVMIVGSDSDLSRLLFAITALLGFVVACFDDFRQWRKAG